MKRPLLKRSQSPKVEIPDLPTVCVPGSTSFEDFLILLYGPPKIGKSTFASKLGNPLFIATEPGLKFLEVRPWNCKNWGMFRAMVEKLESLKKPPADCIVVDTVDNLASFCLNYVCEEKGISHPSELDYGKGWEALKNEWGTWVTRLAMLNMGVIFIGHDTEREIKDGAMMVNKICPAMQKTCYRFIFGLVDFIFYAGFKITKKKLKGGKIKRIEERVLYTRSSSNLEAGSRLVLPETISFDHTTFMEVFFGCHLKGDA